MNTPKFSVFIETPREDSVFSPKDGYLELGFFIVRYDREGEYAHETDKKLAKLCVKVSLSGFNLTTNFGKALENVDHAHV